MSDERFAPEGKIWVCHACGKTSKDQYGMEGEHSRGWDESCMLNSGLYEISQLVMRDGLVSALQPLTLLDKNGLPLDSAVRTEGC